MAIGLPKHRSHKEKTTLRRLKQKVALGSIVKM
jgi:hypothetical protein